MLAGCGGLTNVPPPPVPLTALLGKQAAAEGVSGLPTARRAEVRLLQAVPQGSLLTLQFPDLEAATRAFKKTAIYTLFASGAIQKRLGPLSLLGPSLTLSATGAGAEGKPDFSALVKGELVVALTDYRPTPTFQLDSIHLLVGMHIAAGSGAGEKLLGWIGDAAAARSDVQVEKGTAGGGPFLRIVARPPVHLVLEAAVFKDALFLGLGRDTVTSAVDHLARENDSILAEDSYRTGMDRCSNPADALRVHLDVHHLFEKLLPVAGDEAVETLHGLGLDNVRSLTTAIRFQGRDVVVSSLVDSPGGKDVLSRLLAEHPADSRFFSMIPEDAASFSLFPVDGAEVLHQLRSSLPESACSSLESFLAGLKAQGIDVERDVLPVFGPRCGFVSLPQGGEGASSSGDTGLWRHFLGTAFLIEVQDPDRARSVLAHLPPGDQALQHHELDLPGTSLAGSYSFASSELPDSFCVCYALTDGYLYVAFSEDALRRMLHAGTGSAAAARFKAAFKGVPETAAVLTYSDSEAGLTAASQALFSLVGRFLPGGGAAGAGDAASRLPFDLSPSVSYMVADQRGLYSYSRSPTAGIGDFGGISGLATLAAVLIPNLTRARLEANEGSALNTLRTIQAAEERFRAARTRDSDHDGKGEYAFLAELMGDSRPGERSASAGRIALIPRMQRNAQGDFQEAGYRFRVYLPAEDGSPIGGQETAQRLRSVDGDLSEILMTVVAWPVAKGRTGNRAFYLDASGAIFACGTGPYEGDRPPPPDLFCSQRHNLASPQRPGQPVDHQAWVRVH